MLPLYFPQENGGDKMERAMGDMKTSIALKIKNDPDLALVHAICMDKIRQMAMMGDYEGIGKYMCGLLDGQRAMQQNGDYEANELFY